MEYVKVTFPTRRRVYIDDEPNGYTNEILRIDAGTHVFERDNRPLKAAGMLRFGRC